MIHRAFLPVVIHFRKPITTLSAGCPNLTGNPKVQSQRQPDRTGRGRASRAGARRTTADKATLERRFDHCHGFARFRFDSLGFVCVQPNPPPALSVFAVRTRGSRSPVRGPRPHRSSSGETPARKIRGRMPDNDTRGRDTTQMLAVLVVLVGLALIVLSSAGVVEFSSAMARLVLGAGIILAAGREAIIALVGGVGGRGGNGGGRGGNEGGR